MSNSDDVLDFRVRFNRDESPMLFRAIAGLEAAPGMRKRNLFVRQLMEMGLMVMEERMRRQEGLSSRLSSGLADDVTASALSMARTTARPAAAPAALEPQPTAVTNRPVSADPAAANLGPAGAAAISTSIAAEPVVPAPVSAPTQALQIAAAAAPAPAQTPPSDDDRPPPLTGIVGAVRMLDGESFE